MASRNGSLLTLSLIALLSLATLTGGATPAFAVACSFKGPQPANTPIDVYYDPADSTMKACVSGSIVSLGTGGGGGGGISSLTGDVSASGTGAVTATIANGAVSYAKIQNVSATSRLLGRASAGAGSIEEIAIGSGLTLTGTTLSASSSGSTSSGALGYIQFSGGSGAFNSSSTAAGQQLFWDSTNNRLGIGTTTPAYGLTVAPNGGAAAQTAFFQDQTPSTGQTNVVIKSGASAAGYLLQLQNSAGTPVAGYDVVNGRWFAPSLWLGTGSDGIWRYYSLDLRSDLKIAWSGTTNAASTKDIGLSRGAAGKLYVGNGTASDYTGTLIAGNVGIGTASPATQLHIDSGGYGAITMGANSSLGSLITNETNGDMGFWTGPLGSGPSRIMIKQNGNVGIGTTGPGYKLVTTGSSGPYNGNPIVDVTTGTGATTDESLMFGVHDGDYSWVQAIKPGTAYRNLVLQAGGGNVGIGTTTPANRLDIRGGGETIQGEFHLIDENTSNGIGQQYGMYNWDGTINLANFSAAYAWQSTKWTLDPAGNMWTAGSVTASSGAFISGTRSNFNLTLQGDRNMVLYDNGGAVWSSGTQTSDVRLKEEIKPLEPVLDKLMKLQAIRFRYKKEIDEKQLPQIGVIAQEMEEEFPEFVYRTSDPKLEGGRLLVYYDKLSTVLLRGEQELKQENDKLKQENARLERELRQESQDLRGEIELLKKRLPTSDGHQ